MNRSSNFELKIDFERSKGSYLFDKTRNKKYLDLMGMYATLVLGYNHPIFSLKSFKDDILRVSNVKITNCEMLSDESAEFNSDFIQFTSRDVFTHFHYTCTGALAIEAAIKTALDYKRIENPRIISLKGSFHGINSYGGFLTDRFVPVNGRLEGFPESNYCPLDNPIITYNNNQPVEDTGKVYSVIKEVKKIIKEEKNVAGILVEPIQCTFGDRYFPQLFYKELRNLCDKYDIPLIFDEIQVGFGTTGKVWYYEHTEVVPDILAFGKKTQVSGIMVQKKFAKIFDTPIRLEVTWDGNLIDMIRCKYIIKAFKQYNILNNVRVMSKALYVGLARMKNIINLRKCGLLFAFDFYSKNKRDKFVTSILNNGLVCNPTRDLTVRLRPNLFINIEEVNHALDIIKQADDSL